MRRRARHRAFRARDQRGQLVTGGHGLAHVKGEATEAATRRLFGIQAWAALPKSHEEAAPAFAHHGTAELPRITGEGKTRATGHGFGLWRRGRRSSFPTKRCLPKPCWRRAPCFRSIPIYDERAVYVASGEIDIAGSRFAEGRLADLQSRETASPSWPWRNLGWCSWAEIRWTAPSHLVELRLLIQRSHRAGQGRLARETLCAGAGRREGIYPAAGVKNGPPPQGRTQRGCRLGQSRGRASSPSLPTGAIWPDRSRSGGTGRRPIRSRSRRRRRRRAGRGPRAPARSRRR